MDEADIVMEEFQSLFFWNSRPDSYAVVGIFAQNRSFNPCFSGTRARTVIFMAEYILGMSVSILVFLELAPGLYGLFYGHLSTFLFQSLFFWNSRPDAEAVKPTQSHYCFNPCFSGTRARTFSRPLNRYEFN